MAAWIGVDFDGTLRRADGEPVAPMVARIRHFLEQGASVRILTARVANKNGIEHNNVNTSYIQNWCLTHLGQVLPVTSEKDYEMVVLYDDRAIAVETDIGTCRGWIKEAVV